MTTKPIVPSRDSDHIPLQLDVHHPEQDKQLESSGKRLDVGRKPTGWRENADGAFRDHLDIALGIPTDFKDH